MHVSIRFPRATGMPVATVELPAVPREGEAVETIAGTFVVSQVVWHPFEAGNVVCIELRRP